MTLVLDGRLIPTDGSENILITDVNPTGLSNIESLICQSRTPETSEDKNNWYLNGEIIERTGSQGWQTELDRTNSPNIQYLRLKRVNETAVEGVFTCRIAFSDTNIVSASVGIYYPSESCVY